jgi:aldehyde dehydrogenase (NAD+)
VKAALRWCLYSLFAQADDVEGVIQALKLKDFVLVGHSMGGKIAQIFAGRRPDGLRAVVLAAPAPPTPLYAPDAQKRSMLASYTTPEAIRDALKVINHRPLTIAQRLQVTEDSLGGAEAAKVAWVSQGMVLDISKQTDSITVPVCVIVRSADQVEKEAALREALLPLVPHAKFETIEGVGHLSPLEGPDEVAATISKFLKDLAPAGDSWAAALPAPDRVNRLPAPSNSTAILTSREVPMNPFQKIFDAQKALFASGVTRTYEWRVEQLDRMARMIRENERRFQEAMAKDFKIASQEYIFETQASAGETEVQKSQLKEWMKPVEAPVPRFLAETGHKGMVYREPYGVALIIGPFNGPLLLLIRPALAALAAGNTCILTLSEALPATTAVLLDLVPKYFDPSAVTAVPGGKETNTELLKLPNDFIFFTGSTFVGKIVARAAAESLTPVLLELGGMNPAVVDETANIPDAAKKIVWGAMAWGGQWCTSPGYAYVHESVADAFVAEAKKALLELFGDDPKSNSDYSRIINERAVDRLAGLIDPAKVIAGGKSDRDAHYLDPTLLYPITWDEKIMEDEIFGPILPILTYKSFDEAMARMAKPGRPLAGFIFSRDQKTIDRFIGELSFGGGGVNLVNVHLFVETMPFGGTGSAGMGRYYGKYGFDALTHAKSMLISPPDVAIEHLYSPFTDEKNRALQGWFEY